MATCHLCNEEPDDAEVLHHLRVHHPEQYGDGPELWPDGDPVIIDRTIESPEDLT